MMTGGAPLKPTVHGLSVLVQCRKLRACGRPAWRANREKMTPAQDSAVILKPALVIIQSNPVDRLFVESFHFFRRELAEFDGARLRAYQRRHDHARV